MAAVVAKNGNVRFESDGDTYAPLANKEIMSVVFSPSVATDNFTLSMAGNLIVEGVSGSGDTICISTFGCMNTAMTITYQCSGGTCILYLK